MSLIEEAEARSPPLVYAPADHLSTAASATAAELELDNPDKAQPPDKRIDYPPLEEEPSAEQADDDGTEVGVVFSSCVGLGGYVSDIIVGAAMLISMPLSVPFAHIRQDLLDRYAPTCDPFSSGG
eukprot:scaffold119270_cov41-Prasinocladus_malaysianus.AAC.1